VTAQRHEATAQVSQPRRRLLVATSSAHKLSELRALLDLPATDLVSPADVGLGEPPPEVGSTFEQNACAKALWYSARSGLPTLADDSGLEVDALDGRPGVRTRRFAGEDATDAQNNEHLLNTLGGFLAEDRTARYRAVLAFAEPTGDGGSVVRETTAGVFEGRITFEPRGAGGFGYDPVFEPATERAGGRTVAQLSPAEKNAVSHRGKAARAMRELLVARGF
jgi:XTP/dITP diphosphohydrolase